MDALRGSLDCVTIITTIASQTGADARFARQVWRLIIRICEPAS